MSYAAVAQKYAKALFEQTQATATTAKVEAELTTVSHILNQDAILFFENPFNAISDKMTVVGNTFEGKVSSETLNFIKLLVEKNRVGAIADIATSFSNLSKSLVGTVKGKLFSVTEPSKEFINSVQDTLTKKLNQKVELEFHKDASLVAGFKVEVGGWTIDDSAAAHLNKIKEDLMKRGL